MYRIRVVSIGLCCPVKLFLLEYRYHCVSFCASAALSSCLVKYYDQALDDNPHSILGSTYLSPKCIEFICRNPTVIGLASSFGNIGDFSIGKAAISD